jgi:hypothetical protein
VKKLVLLFFVASILGCPESKYDVCKKVAIDFCRDVKKKEAEQMASCVADQTRLCVIKGK